MPAGGGNGTVVDSLGAPVINVSSVTFSSGRVCQHTAIIAMAHLHCTAQKKSLHSSQAPDFHVSQTFRPAFSTMSIG